MINSTWYHKRQIRVCLYVKKRYMTTSIVACLIIKLVIRLDKSEAKDKTFVVFH